MPLVVSPAISIPDEDLEESFVRASGPGGQNVNKVSSAVQLRFNVRGCAALPDDVALRLMRIAGSKMTRDGVLVLSADRFRDQARNREDARERLAALVLKATHRPKPRIATKPTRAAKEKRLDSKTRHGAIKAGRRARSLDD